MDRHVKHEWNEGDTKNTKDARLDAWRESRGMDSEWQGGIGKHGLARESIVNDAERRQRWSDGVAGRSAGGRRRKKYEIAKRTQVVGLWDMHNNLMTNMLRHIMCRGASQFMGSELGGLGRKWGDNTAKTDAKWRQGW